MSIRDFKIPSIPSNVQKTIRSPEDLVRDVEKLIEGKDCTFTAFVVEAVRVIVEDLKER